MMLPSCRPFGSVWERWLPDREVETALCRLRGQARPQAGDDGDIRAGHSTAIRARIATTPRNQTGGCLHVVPEMTRPFVDIAGSGGSI